MTLLDRGRDYLRRQRTRTGGEKITASFSRGASVNASVPVTQAETTFEKDDGEAIVEASMVDWLIERADLTLASVEVEPRKGDKLTVTFDHGTEEFEFADLRDEGVFRWQGRDGKTYRVHSVRT